MHTIRMTIKNHNQFLITIFFIALIARTLLFFYFTRHGNNALIPFDSQQYLTIAKNIVAGNGVCFKPNSPQSYRIPGYPIFLAVSQYIFGSMYQAILLQIILASLIPVVIFILGMLIFSDNTIIAKTAASLSTIHLGFVLYAGMFATETLCCIFFLLFLLFFFNALQKKSEKIICHFGYAGFFLGIASLIRPIGHFALTLALLIILINQTSKIKKSCTLFFGWIIIVSPWILRNMLLGGSLFFHTLPGLHCLQYLATPIIMQRDNINYAQAREYIMHEYNNQITQNMTEYQQCYIGETITFNYIKNYPKHAFNHIINELFKTVFGLYSAIILLADSAPWPEYNNTTSLLTKIKRFIFPTVQRTFLIPLIYWDIILTIFTILGCTLFCCYSFFCKKMRTQFYVLFPWITLLISLTFAYGGARLRMPADPLLLLAAVCGWVNVTKISSRLYQHEI